MKKYVSSIDMNLMLTKMGNQFNKHVSSYGTNGQLDGLNFSPFSET
jgi:hypothetical protein